MEKTDEYIVSARKYRPATFDSVVGQAALTTTLKNAIKNNKLAHAYLFCGPRGVGKTSCARIFAKTINCMNLTPEGEACNTCESCRSFNEQRSLNIHELDAASNNSVDDIRSLIEQVRIPPQVGRYKVYIIDEVHMLSAAAFNAFLKTLEEPPSYAIFILATTEKHKILPTILSRCQIYDFKRITVQDITRHLRYVADSEGIDAEETALGLIAEKADGGMRDALSMFDRIASFAGGHITYQHALESLNVLDYTYFIRIFELFLSGDHRSVLLLLDELMGKGFEGQTILTGLSAFVRDLLVAQHPDTLQLLEKPDAVAASYATIAQQCTPASLFAALKTLVQADQQYRGATNKRLLVELSFLSMVPLFKRDSDLNLPATPAPAAPQTATPQAAPQTPPATTPPASPSPKAQTAPVAAPAPQVAPKPAPTAVTPPPAAAEPAPAPAPAVSATPSPPAPPSSAPKRLFGARRRADAPSEATSTPPAEAPAPVEDKDFTEDDLQRAWVRFVEQELTPSQILYRNILRPELPKLLDGVQAEISLPPGEAIHTTVMEVYPQLVEFLRTTLQNRKFNLVLREKTVEEQAKIVLTQEDRFNQLAEINPEVRKLKEALGLRFS